MREVRRAFYLPGMTPFVETKHLRIRGYRDADLPLILALWNDPRVQRTGSSECSGLRTAQWATEVLAPQIETALVAVVLELRQPQSEGPTVSQPEADGVVLGDEGAHKFVGYVLLQLDPRGDSTRDAVLAIALSPEWWGRGYGTEALGWTVDHAFQALGLHRISLAVMDCNEPAIALYKKMSASCLSAGDIALTHT
jgi:RimJ/RimL family protein N-acetyltransferase